jgi:hypothetical protein
VSRSSAASERKRRRQRMRVTIDSGMRCRLIRGNVFGKRK